MSDDIPSVEQAAKLQHVVKDNPICQKCKKAPSVQISRWGKILACCEGCLQEELREFNASPRHRTHDDDYYPEDD